MSNSSMETGTGYAQWRMAALFALTLTCVVATLLFAHTLMFPIIGAITLAVVTQPLSVWLRKRWSPTLAGIAMVVLVSLVLFVPMYVLIKHLVVQAIALARYVESGGVDDFFAELAVKHPKLGDAIQNAITQFAPGMSGRAIAGWSAPKLGQAFGAIVHGIVSIVLLLFFYFFLVRDEAVALRAWESILPLRDDETFDFSRKLRDIIDAIFAGRLLIAMLQGVASGVAYWLVGVPGALLWGFVTFICCLIPAFGAFLAWVPICLYVGLVLSWTKCLILAIWCSAVVSTMDNFLYPVFVGKKTDLHTGVVFVAIFGGLAFFGISGFILGPVLVASAILLLQIWKQRLAEAGVH
ncbi:AI-2E family transporter [Terriglobus roseus]|nr:AI-2E family transporter [Terriglobus roseus]